MHIKIPCKLLVSGFEKSFGAIARAFGASRWSRSAAVLTLCVLCVGVACPAADAQTDEWAWMSGSSTVGSNGGQPGVYGLLKTYAAGDVPGGREAPVSWTDSSGNLWLFGGIGLDSNGVSGFLNDLWIYYPSTKEWVWMGGSSTVPCTYCGTAGSYGPSTQFGSGYIPGGRTSASSWTDSSGNFWLFGGNGADSTGTVGELNDLWEFNPTTKEWAWMGGSSTVPCSGCGQSGNFGDPKSASTGNIPSGRDSATSWVDSSGNFWLFGGEGDDSTGASGYLNDIWEFIPGAGTWAWMGGSSTVGIYDGQFGEYGSPQTPGVGNTPGSRFSAVGWPDGSGHLWLFGGFGFDSEGNFGPVNDVWEFFTSNDEWAWMGGSSTLPGSYISAPGVYGTSGTFASGNIPTGREYASGWVDSSGYFWLFGGYGNDADSNNIWFNDLWVLNPQTDEWAWMDGSSAAGQVGSYGRLGAAAAANVPGARGYSTSLTDLSGDFWLFGGYGADSTGAMGALNDLWEYQPSIHEPAAILSPLPGGQLASTSATFTWRPGNESTHFELWVGNNGPGSTNIYDSGNVTATSETVSGLPTNGQTVYVRLYYLVNGAWQYANYTYTASGSPTQAALTTPTPNTATPLTGTSTTFSWTPGNVATHFELYVGTSVGSSNVYGSGNVTATSETVSDLPSNGQTFYVRLYSLIDGAWQYTNYTYVASGSPTPATLTTPTPDTSSPLSGTSVSFSWNPGNEATHFELFVGTSVGSSNLYGSGNVTATSETVSDLPSNGQTLYVRLYSLIDGVWQYTNYTYVASGSPTPAVLTTPTPDTSTPVSGTSVTFSWNPGNLATHFEFIVGTSVGSSNLYGSGSVTATAETVSDLPSNGQTFYARLYSLINGAWQYNDYTYKASGSPTPAALTTPTPDTNTPLSGTSVTFSWNPGNLATHFEFIMGTSVGSSNLYGSGSVTATSETVSDLPSNGEKLYARLYSLINGAWQYIDYTYTAF